MIRGSEVSVEAASKENGYIELPPDAEKHVWVQIAAGKGVFCFILFACLPQLFVFKTSWVELGVLWKSCSAEFLCSLASSGYVGTSFLWKFEKTNKQTYMLNVMIIKIHWSCFIVWLVDFFMT